MAKTKDPDPEPVAEETTLDDRPTRAELEEIRKHKHDDHPTRAELEELRKHKHDEPKPAVDEKPTPAVIDKPPPEVKQKEEKKSGVRLLW